MLTDTGVVACCTRSVQAWDGGSLDHIAFGGGIGAWLWSAAGYSRDPWTGQVTLRVQEPWLLGAASVSRHVVGEGKTGWSWRYNGGTHSVGRGVRDTGPWFEANVSIPLGRSVEVWLSVEPQRMWRWGRNDLRKLVVRDRTGAILWSERQGVGDDRASTVQSGRVEPGEVVLKLASGDYQLYATQEYE